MGNEFKIRSFYIDEQNTLLIKSNDKLIIVKLLLKNMKPRMIGTVTKSTRTIEMRRKRGKHKAAYRTKKKRVVRT